VKLGGGKEWFTAAELADLALAGLGNVKRRINETAASEGWALRTGRFEEPLARPRAARGGGLEYHISVLPAAARVSLAAMGVAASADIVAAPEAGVVTGAAQMWRWFDGTSVKVKAEASRRIAAISEIEAYESAGMTRSAAVAEAAKTSAIGASTLWSWVALIEGVAASDRLPYLAPRRAGGGASSEVDAECWQVLISDYLRPEKPTFTSCYRRMERDFAKPRGLTVPIERTLRRKFEREVDGRLVILRREGLEALRRSQPAQERSVMELHAMEAVNIDGHKFDVFVEWEDGRIGRPMMIGIQDIYSRKLLAHRIDESENALATRLTFADLFRDYGIPRACLLDNGRAFASKLITGGAKSRFRFKIKDEEPTGILTALGIKIHWATPYRGQSKPIERAWRDLCDTISKHPALAGAYTGNKPDAKPENYGSKAIPIAEFRAVVAAGIASHNAQTGRRTETTQGGSFDATFSASYAVSPVGKATIEQLRLALLTAEERSCDRQTGVVTLEGNRYWAPELADHAGKKLTLRFDPENLHGEIHVYDRTGGFICTAPVIEKTGFFDKAEAGKAKAQTADLRRQVKEVERLQDLIDVAALAALMPAQPDTSVTPIPAVVRPVRHRGQTAAALKPVSEVAQMPVPNVIDRIANLRLVG
jgi:putative transposase